LTIGLAFLTLLAGLLPAGVAYVGKLIVDSVILAAKSGKTADQWQALSWVGLEAGLVMLLMGMQKGISVIQSLLRVLMAQQINVMVLEKAMKLELSHFEDSQFYDKMTRARRGASSRPLSLVTRTFGLFQNGISLVSYGWLLLQFSGWTVLVLVLAALPAFLVETRFSGEAFRLFRWKVPETRKQNYLEVVLAREDYAKEVKLYQLGPLLLERYREIFERLYAEDRSLALRRGFWGYALGLLSTIAFYGAYMWIAWSAILARITLGEMTMYLLVFKQGQSAITASLTTISRMYEDNLYLTNLYEFLEEPLESESGTAKQGPKRGDGIRFENVSFAYPGETEMALREINLHLKPGEKLALVGENGSGKTTLIKLLTRLYQPTLGRVTLDGLDLREWDEKALRERVGVIFQDFARYQFTIGENIGAGDVQDFDNRERWKASAEKGLAQPFIERLAKGYDTQLGRWFENGRELSLGQWQKVALARAFMRGKAEILVLDEPTSAMDPEAEAQLFAYFREKTKDQMAILISHRFSTVRMADQIIVLDKGTILEKGTHEHLMNEDGHYAHLFTLQAQGYQ
jgi:ABC-type multidrug transport system fused ATPase/permease subunit